jgi:septal ring factor EnvC (AmiA/AmiB activator)
MKIIRVEQIDWKMAEHSLYKEEYRGNIVIEQKDSLSVPFVYIFQESGVTFWHIESTTGVTLVNHIETLEKNCYEGTKALIELQKRDKELNEMVMNAEKNIEMFELALKEKDAMLNTAHDTLGALDKKLSEQRQYIKDLEKTLDAVKAPEPTQSGSEQEALARALVILAEKFSPLEIGYLKLMKCI